MIRFSDGFLSAIRDRLPLSDVVGRRVSWDRRKSKPTRGDHWACCPFHSEKTPSFHVDDRKGRYHCFGCQASGDHFRFVMETEGLSFPEAVEKLAGEAGLAMPTPDPEAAKRHEARLKLHDVLELAATFFEQALQSRDGADALAYAERRGLDAALRATFRVGYAPDRRDALLTYLQNRNVPVSAMVETGLVIQPEEPGRQPYDRFRGRLMVAIEDLRGRVVGFGGRVLGQGEPKYLNSPETEFFRKREMLFNAQRAREAAHRSKRLLLVEGYMDAIALHRAGFADVAASLGTALGEEQIALMWRMTDEPILCFDGDQAGVAAAHRTMDRVLPLLKPGKSLRFLFLPQGQDPDDFLAEHGPQVFAALLDKAEPLIEALWSREVGSHDVSTPERMAAFQSSLGRLSASIGDGSVRAHYDQALKDRFYAFRRSLRAAGTPGRSGPAGMVDRNALAGGGYGAKTVKAPTPMSLEAQLVHIAEIFPQQFAEFEDRDPGSLFEDPLAAQRLERIAGHSASSDLDQNDQPMMVVPSFPLLERDASPRIVSMVMAYLISRLELRAVQRDVERSQADVLEDEAALEHALALSTEARTMQQRLAELEQALDEEASLLRVQQAR